MKKAMLVLGTSTVAMVVFGTVVTGVGARTPTLKRQTLYLDSYEKRSKTAGPVSTRRRLARGKWYLVAVKGTISYFSRGLLRKEYCGRPEARPQRRSKGRANARVFADVETVFALPRRRGRGCPPLPHHWGNFEMTAGKRFSHIDPIGGAPTRANRRHRYLYLLKGRGKVARFMLRDSYPRDNYGVLTIRLRRATASEVVRGQPPAPAPSLPAPTAGG